MEIHSPTLFIEINNSEYIFTVGDANDQENFKLIYKSNIPIQGIKNFRVIDFNLVLNIIKNNILIIEQKLNFTFKETVLILNNFNFSFVNLTGFKKLNGSQILRENVTYILNSLKSYIDETENKKTIIHIFNSKYTLDGKKIDNLPIGLFGDFYSHELSFCLINNNDYKNLKNIFKNCNLKINRILLKSFVEGSLISNNNSDLDTFFQIKVNENNSELLYFENDTLKFEQKFNFGTDLITKDISKVTSLKMETIDQILAKNKLTTKISNDELVEQELFKRENYRKIRKKLIFEIAEARIHELVEILIIKNINLSSYKKENRVIFINIINKIHFNCFKEVYSIFFSNNNFKVEYLESITTDKIMKNANQLVQYGWKKEAIPMTHPRKSFIARFFDILFS
jgi:cell division protein FtsA